MSAPLPPLLGLLTLPVIVAIVAYVVSQRPRAPSSVALVACSLAFSLFYLGEYFLYRPGLGVEEGFLWQRLQTVAAGIASIGALALILGLREERLAGWERFLVGVLVLRAVLDAAFVVAMQPVLSPACYLPSGLPKLHCDSINLLTSAIAVVALLLTLGFFLRTVLLASSTQRRIMQRYFLPAALLASLATFLNLAWGVYPTAPIFPSGILGLPAAVLVAGGLLALEQPENPRRVEWPAKSLFVWAALLVFAVILDAIWLRSSGPLLSVLTLAGGIAVAVAHTARSTPANPVGPVLQSEPQTVATLSDTQSVSEVVEDCAGLGSVGFSSRSSLDSTPLRIRLFGPLRVESDGETLSSSTDVWRSNKTKSLLAYLVLARDAGLTRTQIIDALWPVDEAEEEQKSINSFHSYLSTLRHLLEPSNGRGGYKIITHHGGRYRIEPTSGIWIDVWEFEQQVKDATASAESKAVMCAWERAVSLYGELGLLPDDENLPLEIIEAERERLRQSWLRGLRFLARRYQETGKAEQAVWLWRLVWREAPLDDDAYLFLTEHYRKSGQLEQSAVLNEERRRILADQSLR